VKFISGLFKFIAGVLMAVVVFGLPFALLIQGFGSLLLSPGKLVEMLEEHVIDPEVISSFAEYQVSQIEFEPSSENAYMQIVLDGMNNLEHEEWVLLTTMIAPPELISQTLDDGLAGYYRWLDGTSDIPGIRIDLRPWKGNLSTNLIPVLEMVMYALPECTDEQQMQFLSADQLSVNAESCRPQDPVYAIFIEQAGISLPALLENMPNEFNLGKSLQQNQQIDWAAAKESLSGLAFISQSSWMVLLVVFSIAIPMGARSFSGVFKWAGWPIILAGMITLILGMLLIFISQGALAELNPAAGMIESVPPVLSQSIGKLVGAGLRFVARPLLIEAAAMLLLGGIAVIIGIILASRAARDEPAASVPVVGSRVTGPTPIANPVETTEYTEEQLDQPPEEEDKPSGMFG
jgi:hypothetical protein